MVSLSFSDNWAANNYEVHYEKKGYINIWHHWCDYGFST